MDEEVKQIIEETSISQKYQRQRQPSRIYPVTEGVDSPKTKVEYSRCLNHFLDFIKIHDYQVLLDFSLKVIKQIIIDYILWLRDEKPGKKLSRSSIKVYLAAILHFFQINNDDFNLTMRHFRIHLPSDDTEVINEDRPYTREEIAQVIENGCNSDLRSKVVILLLCGSGLRMGAISLLRTEDLIPMEYKGLNIFKVQVYARTRDRYYTFTTVESAKTISDYLDYRQRYGERLTDKSPLIREQFNIDDHLRIQNPRFVTDKAIEYLINQVVTRSGVRKPGKVHMSHGFRKFFISQSESSPMKSLHVSMLSGHTTGIKKHYYIPKDSVILEDFMTHAADALTISQEKRLKQENQDLKTTQAQEIDRLKMQLDEKDRHLRQTVEALEIKSKNSIDRIEKEIIKLRNGVIVGERITDNVTGTHCYRYKKA
jgi:integrase